MGNCKDCKFYEPFCPYDDDDSEDGRKAIGKEIDEYREKPNPTEEEIKNYCDAFYMLYYGHCYRFPPIFHIEESNFPEVWEGRWCGEFVKKIDETLLVLDGFSCRARNVFRMLGIQTIGQFLQLNEREVLSVNKAGEMTLHEIKVAQSLLRPELTEQEKENAEVEAKAEMAVKEALGIKD